MSSSRTNTVQYAMSGGFQFYATIKYYLNQNANRTLRINGPSHPTAITVPSRPTRKRLSAIKAILDVQANYQRQLQQLQVLATTSSKRIAREKASREDLALTTAECAGNTSQLSKLSGDIATTAVRQEA